MPADERVAETESKHTSGPWVYDKRPRPGAADGCEIRTVAEVTGGAYIGAAYSEANARLIAAAPDMLQALHEVADDCYVLDGEPDSTAHCRFCDHSEGARHDIDCVMGFINAAISKAEGRA